MSKRTRVDGGARQIFQVPVSGEAIKGKSTNGQSALKKLQKDNPEIFTRISRPALKARKLVGHKVSTAKPGELRSSGLANSDTSITVTISITVTMTVTVTITMTSTMTITM